MLRSKKSRLATVLAAAALSLGLAVPAAAAPQVGLVNVNIEDNVVQLPVALAANVCDVNVAVLVADLRDDGSADCNAAADSSAEAAAPGTGGGGGPQSGLVNVDVSGNTVQVPLAVALNICDVNAAVLVGDLQDDGDASCIADASSDAKANRS